MALPDALFGTDLKAYFNQNYNAGTGTFVDDIGNATNLTQSTSGNRPSADTSTAPSGRLMLSCDGVDDRLTGGNISSGALASYAGSGYWVEFAIIKRPATQDNSDFERIIDYNGDEYFLLSFGDLYRAGATGDSNIDGNVKRVIIVHNEGTGLVTLYINGTAQTDTGGAGSEIRNHWINGKAVGARGTGTEPYEGLIGCFGWIQRSTFGSTEIANLDAAMDEWWTTAAGGGGSAPLDPMGAAGFFGI